MNQKILGALLMIIGVSLFFSIYSYASTLLSLSAELHKNCPLPEGICPYRRSIPFEYYFGFSLSSIIFATGIYIAFLQKRSEKFTGVERSKIKKVIKTLEGEEKQIFGIIVNSDGTIFQSDLVKKTGLSKVKISRILDRLEAKGLIERRRRGMANIVVLKYLQVGSE